MSETNEKRVDALIKDIQRRKPEFIQSANTDKLIAVVLRLAMEISVLQDRNRTYEALLKAKGLIAEGEVDSFKPDADETKQRMAAKFALIEAISDDLL